MAEKLEQSPPDMASESLPPSKQSDQSPSAAQEVTVVTDSNTGGLQQYPVADAVCAAVESGLIRNQGAKMLLQSLVQLREVDLADAREERQSARKEGEHFKENFFNERTKSAVLTERLRGDLKLKKLQNVMITLGGVMLGAGLPPLLTAFSVTYCAVAVLGLVLLIAGWSYPAASNEENQ